MNNFNVRKAVTASQVKEFRKSLHMTQAQFAAFMGVSKPTAERWEISKKDIRGPIAVLIDLMEERVELIEQRTIPKKEYPLRLRFMFQNKCCSIIDVDILNQKIKVRNYARNILFRAFGAKEDPTYDDLEVFLRSRCFPESRDKMKIQLKMLNLPFYDPWAIIEKTQGRMADDEFWIMIER